MVILGSHGKLWLYSTTSLSHKREEKKRNKLLFLYISRTIVPQLPLIIRLEAIHSPTITNQIRSWSSSYDQTDCVHNDDGRLVEDEEEDNKMAHDRSTITEHRHRDTTYRQWVNQTVHDISCSHPRFQISQQFQINTASPSVVAKWWSNRSITFFLQKIARYTRDFYIVSLIPSHTAPQITGYYQLTTSPTQKIFSNTFDNKFKWPSFGIISRNAPIH